MSDPQLRELTASEELTLEEEYEMMEKWKVDDDSESTFSARSLLISLIAMPISLELTFIILSREPTSGSAPQSSSTSSLDPATIKKECPMIGDINMFFKAAGTVRVEEGERNEEDEVEIEIMIAGKHNARKILTLSIEPDCVVKNPIIDEQEKPPKQSNSCSSTLRAFQIAKTSCQSSWNRWSLAYQSITCLP